MYRRRLLGVQRKPKRATQNTKHKTEGLLELSVFIGQAGGVRPSESDHDERVLRNGGVDREPAISSRRRGQAT